MKDYTINEVLFVSRRPRMLFCSHHSSQIGIRSGNICKEMDTLQDAVPKEGTLAQLLQ